MLATLPYFVQCLAPCRGSRLFSNSNILICLQVCWGRSLLCVPCGFHSRALLAMCSSSLLNNWPIQPQALRFIFSSIGGCPVCFQSYSLWILLGHQIHRMFLRLIDEHLQLLLQSLGQPPSFRTIQEHCLHI